MNPKAILTICALAMLLFAGCSDDDKNPVGHDSTLVGTWNLMSGTVGGQPAEVPNWIAALSADGTGTWTEDGQSEPLAWHTNGSTLTISWPESPADGSISGTFAIVDGSELAFTFTLNAVAWVSSWTKQPS